MNNNERVGGSCGVYFKTSKLTRETLPNLVKLATKKYRYEGFPGGYVFEKAQYRKPIEEKDFHIEKIKTRAGTLGVFLKV